MKNDHATYHLEINFYGINDYAWYFAYNYRLALKFLIANDDEH